MPRDPDDDPPPWTRGEVVALSSAARPAEPEFWIDPGSWVERAVPRRPWIVRGYLMRGTVTLMTGAGSSGKSMLAIAWSIALALGRPWGRFAVSAPSRSLIFNVEDDQNEQRLRLSAALRQWGAYPSDLGDRLVRCGPVRAGLLLQFDPLTQTISRTPLMRELAAAIDHHRPDVVFLDPLVELHGAGENDNTALRAVVGEFRALAVEHQTAVVLLHHHSKGQHTPGDPDSSRGASAIISAARVGLTVTTMSPEEAEEFGIAPDTRRQYARLDGSKSNYAPAREAEWMEQVEYDLDNGERVSALVPWRPPAQGAPALDVMAAIVTGIERGTEAGLPWSPKLSGEPRSVRHLLAAHGVLGRKAEAAAVAEFEAAGVYAAEFWHLGKMRRAGYRTDAGPAAKWVRRRDE